MAEWEGGFCKCDNCGKRVYVESIDLWAYKMTTKRKSNHLFACSWSCLQALRQKYEEQGRYIVPGLAPKAVRDEY